MAINRLEYPIDYDEAISTLQSLSNEILNHAQEHMICGDTRPEIINWTIRQLERLKKFEDAKPHRY